MVLKSDFVALMSRPGENNLAKVSKNKQIKSKIKINSFFLLFAEAVSQFYDICK